MAIYVGRNKVSKIYIGRNEITNIITNKQSVGNTTTTTSAGLSDISTLTYDSSRSYTGDSYPISRYGGAFFYPKDDGTRLAYTYSDYNTHSHRYIDLGTAWDFSTVGTSNNGSSINLTNHYQTSWWVNADGTRIFTGGYSNSYASGWDDIYGGTISGWDVRSPSWTTYGNNPRSSWNAHTSYTMLGWKDDGTKWLMGTSVDASGTQQDYRHYIKEFSTSVAFSQDASYQTLENTFDLGGALSINPYYSSGNGTTVGTRCMNRAGTQIIAQTVVYSSSTIQSYNFYTVDVSTAFDVSTATIDSSKSLDLLTVHQGGSNFGISDVKYGKDEAELIVGQGSGAYGSTNGVKGRWLVYS